MKTNEKHVNENKNCGAKGERKRKQKLKAI